jgi:hypothetical protein
VPLAVEGACSIEGVDFVMLGKRLRSLPLSVGEEDL